MKRVSIGLAGGLAIAAAGMITSPASAAEVGKYLCIVSRMAGVQFEKDGGITSGNFKPAEDKFFLTVAPVTPLPECPSTRMKELNYWYFCLAKYAAQKDAELVMRGDSANAFIGMVGGDYLDLTSEGMTSDVTFTSITGILSGTGYYISYGKCTKI